MPPRHSRLSASLAEIPFRAWRHEIHVHLRRWTSNSSSPDLTLAASTRWFASRNLTNFQGWSSVRRELQPRDWRDHFVVNLTTPRAAALHPAGNDVGLHDLLEGGFVLSRRIHDLH